MVTRSCLQKKEEEKETGQRKELLFSWLKTGDFNSC